MPAITLLELVAQIQCLMRQANAKKTLTFTNPYNEDIDVFYAASEHTGDGASVAHAHDEPVGVD